MINKVNQLKCFFNNDLTPRINMRRLTFSGTQLVLIGKCTYSLKGFLFSLDAFLLIYDQI